jgi:hypothetical protein
MPDSLPPQFGPSEPEFSMPQDQLVAEMNLIEKYKGTPWEIVMGNNLDEMRRFAGISIPRYSTPKRIDGSELTEEDKADEQNGALTRDVGGGFIELSSTNPPDSFAILLLKPRLEDPTQDEYAAWTDEQKVRFSHERFGQGVYGDELPTDTVSMLHDLYGLIGAKKVMDHNDETYHAVMYKGLYMGTEIYIQTIRTKWENSSLDEHGERMKTEFTTYQTLMYGSESGAHKLLELTHTDYRRLKEVGISPREARRLGIDQTNILIYVDTFKDVQGVLEGAADAREIDGTKIITEDGVDRTAQLAGGAAEAILTSLGEIRNPKRVSRWRQALQARRHKKKQ